MDKKILIVEDEQAIQKILSEPLAFAGYKVTATSDGLEGINKFHQENFDLVLLDIMLPKIDCNTLCEMIRQESQVAVILLTAPDTEDARIKGFEVRDVFIFLQAEAAWGCTSSKRPYFPCLAGWTARPKARCCFRGKILRRKGLSCIAKTM